MPTISIFYGIVIQMFWQDHSPPHFHALYAEHEALIDIRTLEVIQGHLPKRALALVLEWASEHRAGIIGGLGTMHTHATTEEDRTPEIVPPISPRAPWRIAEVGSRPGYRLHVRFNDGTEGTVDMARFLGSSRAGVFSTLRDEALFQQVRLKWGVVTWPGDLDLAPDAMYAAIKQRGEWVLY